ncbi:MAG: plastocyanin/azurin family copper-binding protein [Actinomycetota bacterium]
MGRIPTRLAVASLVALAALGLPPAGAAAGVRAESSDPTDAVGTLIDTVRVRTIDFAFRPRSITVVRGTRVRWINRGDTSHTSTSNRDIWDSGLLDPGEAYSRVFRREGTFRYHCSVHPAIMRGIVTVT